MSKLRVMWRGGRLVIGDRIFSITNAYMIRTTIERDLLREDDKVTVWGIVYEIADAVWIKEVIDTVLIGADNETRPEPQGNEQESQAAGKHIAN